MNLAAAIEDPRDGLYSHLEVAVAIGLVLAIAALVIAFVAAASSATTRDRMDVLEDRLTPSFAEEHAETVTWQSMIEVRRPTPFPRTDTDESDLPLQVASIELAGPPPEEPVTYREFTLSDGSVRRFEIKREE